MIVHFQLCRWLGQTVSDLPKTTWLLVDKARTEILIVLVFLQCSFSLTGSFAEVCFSVLMPWPYPESWFTPQSLEGSTIWEAPFLQLVIQYHVQQAKEEISQEQLLFHHEWNVEIIHCVPASCLLCFFSFPDRKTKHNGLKSFAQDHALGESTLRTMFSGCLRENIFNCWVMTTFSE